MTYNSRLFNKPMLRRIVEIADDIANECNDLADILANYENADELPSADAVIEREEARAEAWSKVQSILHPMSELAALADKLAAGDDT